MLATGFKQPKGGERAREVVHVGNPVRKAIIDAVRPYAPPPRTAPFHLLVFGGSQGARVFSGLIPGALARASGGEAPACCASCSRRGRRISRRRAHAFAGIGVEAEVEPFFTDMGERLADAHLVICRAGASTVAELAVVGRPAILVPYPHALDHDQAENARVLAEAGGGWLMPESELTATDARPPARRR